MGDRDDLTELPDFGNTSFTKKYHSEPDATISPSRSELTASGKNIVITGGGTGIGKSIALAFTQAGASSVTILGRREDRLITASKEIAKVAEDHQKSTKVLYRVTDLTSKVNVDESFKSVSDTVGALHILVSNAGVFPGAGLLSNPSNTEALMGGFETNVRGALNAVQAFVPLSSSAPDGSPATILNVATGTHMAPMAGYGIYMVSKAANHKMMDFVAAEHPELHVVSLSPGVILTEMSEPAKDMVSKWDSREFVLFSFLRTVDPDRRFSTAHDLLWAGSGLFANMMLLADLPGHFCVWLASPEARFLKSKFVWANWDADELITRKEEIQNSRLLTWLLDGVPM
jgi:NAD(P)-dependent dehydrogenase (short-subunit alcohol dehydrogenase family)